MKKLFLFLYFVFFMSLLYAQDNPKNDSLKNILIITCHPDDWELGMGGTAYLLKDNFHIHVIIASDGELGNTWNTTGIPDPKLGAHRVEDSEKSGKMINATNYFFKLADGNVYATQDAVDKTIKLLQKINPSIIFLHWPIDKPDHIAASAMAMMALTKADMIYDREIYFFEVDNLNHFIPDMYIDVTPVWDKKMEMIQLHERFNDDRIKKIAIESNIKHGYYSHCDYAEGFIPFFPFSNVRNGYNTKCSLIDLIANP